MGERPNPQMKKTLREYYQNNALGYVCHICKKIGLTLYKVGQDRNHHTVYGCAEHRIVR